MKDGTRRLDDHGIVAGLGIPSLVVIGKTLGAVGIV